ncbi:MAG TPA: tetratricopeptide repeat protein, partial [bacterium]|nr:tetratricopeptide repeat protein [bacterium]
MRAIVAFLLSFVLAVTIGSLILPDNTPKIKPKRLVGTAPVPPTLDFLPGLPSLIVPRLDDASKRYEKAWRLLKAGKYRAAEGAYLQILIRNPQDQKAVQGLVMLQRLLANQDPKRLQEQAEGYRRTIALGQVTEEQYSPRELELLAEASLSAANEIVSEQNLKVSSLSKVTIVTDERHPPVPSQVSVLRDPMGAIKERITQLATSLGVAPAKTDIATGEK